ncbi:GrpB family protein [Bradyrhizobium sp. B097]|uniref:GrpB family protein n=1 Tax=Bradyrhizobium sp. B097 TaxID=3140244 RepID=UPI00318469D4
MRSNQGVNVEKYGAGSIVVSDYDPNWPALFAQERTRIEQALGAFALAIEHVGSTAVPGLPSKPIIDLLVGVRSLEAAGQRCIERLEALGYIYMPDYASWIPGELFFRKGPPGPWTHHLHMMEPSHPRWEARLVFRDYLRAHGEVARAYAEIKRALAASSKDDIEAYRTGKDAFVQETTAKAWAWRTAARDQ